MLTIGLGCTTGVRDVPMMYLAHSMCSVNIEDGKKGWRKGGKERLS